MTERYINNGYALELVDDQDPGTHFSDETLLALSRRPDLVVDLSPNQKTRLAELLGNVATEVLPTEAE